MAWRDDLGKGKYKTAARKRSYNAPKIILALIIIAGIVFLLFHFNVISLPFNIIFTGTGLSSSPRNWGILILKLVARALP